MGKCSLEQYSRISGFMRPLKQWNKGKVSEYDDRKEYDFEKAKEKDKQ